MRPNLLITRTYLRRATLLWIGARILVGAVLAAAEVDPVHLTLAATMVIVGASVALGVAEVYRRHERALLENLAVSRAALLVLLAAPAILGEIGISLAAYRR